MPGFGIRVRHVDDVRHVSDSRMQRFARFSGERRINGGAMRCEGAKHNARQRR